MGAVNHSGGYIAPPKYERREIRPRGVWLVGIKPTSRHMMTATLGALHYDIEDWYAHEHVTLVWHSQEVTISGESEDAFTIIDSGFYTAYHSWVWTQSLEPPKEGTDGKAE